MMQDLAGMAVFPPNNPQDPTESEYAPTEPWGSPLPLRDVESPRSFAPMTPLGLAPGTYSGSLAADNADLPAVGAGMVDHAAGAATDPLAEAGAGVVEPIDDAAKAATMASDLDPQAGAHAGVAMAMPKPHGSVCRLSGDVSQGVKEATPLIQNEQLHVGQMVSIPQRPEHPLMSSLPPKQTPRTMMRRMMTMVMAL